MGQKNSNTNTTDVTTDVTQQVYNTLKNTMDIEAEINTSVDQTINIRPPTTTECKNITVENLNVNNGTIMQTTSEETMNALSSALNSKLDETINQANKNGIAFLDSLFRPVDDQNTTAITNKIKNEVHNSIVNAVKQAAKINSNYRQTINFNIPLVDADGKPIPDKFPTKFTCGSAIFRNVSATNSQIGEVATSVIKNVAGATSVTDETIKAAQTNTGFAGDLVSAFASIISKIMTVVIIVAIVGIIVTAVGGLIYFVTRPSHPKSADTLLDGIASSLSSTTSA